MQNHHRRTRAAVRGLLLLLLVASRASAGDLTLARTQSAVSHDVLAGAPLVVTWTLGNDGIEALDAPLLATTLAAGVVVDAVEPPARTRGRDLVVPLPPVPPGGTTTVRLTLRVPAGAATVDDGARAFASRGTRSVEASAGPTTLRATLGADPSLLAWTADAPTNDPGVLRMAGRTGCTPAALLAAVRDETTTELYRGALRGARGVLRTSAGNALDRASLLVALLRACGIPARWAAGTLDDAAARARVESMFDGLAPRAIGGLALAALPFGVTSDLSATLLEPAQLLAAAGMLADPAADPALLALAKDHHWVEYLDGGGFVALDPSFDGAPPATVATFAAVPDDEHHTVRLRLDAEIAPLGLSGKFLQIADALAAALGTPNEQYDHVGNVLVETHTVLDATFTSVELVGQPLTLGHFVAGSTFGGAGLTSTRNVYAPWLQVGDRPDLIRGTDVEEFISTFSSDLLTGLVLRFTVTDPDGVTTEHERELLDRIGYAARREGGASAVALDGAPALTDADVVTVDVNVGGWDRGDGLARADETAAALAALQAAVAALPPGTPSTLETTAVTTLGRRYATAVTRYLTDAQLGASFGREQVLGRALGVRGYAAAPRLTLAAARSRTLDGAARTTLSLDLRKRDGVAVVAPGRPLESARAYEAARGLADSHVEGLVVETFGGTTAPVSFARFVEAVVAGGETFLPIEPANAGDVDLLALPPDALARIRTAIAGGAVVLAPRAPALVDGRPVTMWIEADPDTGEMISVAEDGGHQAALEYEALGSQATQGILIGYLKGLDCDGCSTTATAFQLAFAAAGVAGGGAGAIAGGINGATSFADLLGAGLPPQTPWESAGWIVGTATKILIGVSNAVVKALQHVDPPLSHLVVDPDVLFGAPSRATAVVTTPASLSGTTFSADVAARHHRAAGAAFYPAAVATGLGTGGEQPALNFAPDTTLALAGADVALDAQGGQVTIGAEAIAPPVAMALTGVTGSFDAADDGTTDAVGADGSFERALFVETTPPAGDAARDAALVVAPRPRSNADDQYDLTVEAPAGWEVAIAADGATSLRPPAGTTSGSAAVRFAMRSRTVPSLAADTLVTVDVVPPGTPRVLLALAPDPTSSVPIAGTLVPTAQRLTLTNLGAAADTFDVVVDGLGPDDVTLARSALAVGAGESALVGLALHPGGVLLPPGTPMAFTVRATGRTSGLTASLPATIPFPTVVGVRPRLEPLGARALPGDALAVRLVLEAAGNAPSTMTLASFVPPGLDLDGVPSSVTLAPGETRNVDLDLAVAADATIGRSLPIGITADLCNGLASPPCTVPDPSERLAAMGVLVGAPETLCLLDGAIASALEDLAAPAVTLQRLGLVLSRLAATPDDRALQSEAIDAANDAMVFLHQQGLTERANQLHDAMLPVEAGEPTAIAAALDGLCTTLAGLPGELVTVAQRAAYGFTARLTPSSRVVAPGQDAVYPLELVSTGSRTATIDLTLAGVPAGVTAVLSASQVTIPAGGRLDGTVTATLRSAQALPSTIGFAVQGASAGGFATDAPGLLAVRESDVDVVAVTPSPRLADAAGTPVAVAAVLSNRANVGRDVAIDLRVEDDAGAVVLQRPLAPATLGTGGDTTVDLDPIDTTGLADGAYTAVVGVRTTAGAAIAGREGRATFLVGLPLQAVAVVEPATVAPGDAASVVSRVRVSGTLPRRPGTGFFDQYPRTLVEATSVTAPEQALGAPDRVRAEIAAGGTLVVDLGAGLARVVDGPGADLVVFERDDCSTPHTGGYTVAVADDPAGPFVVLGTVSGARVLGDEFDLFAGGVTGARYVQIAAGAAAIQIDAVLNASPARPGGVRIEYHFPIGTGGGVANTPAIGDLDGDGHPEIAFNAQTSFVGCEMVVLDGVTKTEKFRLDMPGRTTAGAPLCGEASGVAMGNLDDDPQGELLVHLPTDNVKDVFVALNADGTELFRKDIAGRGLNQTSIDLANLDADPRPEILWPGGFRDDDTTSVLDNGLFGQPVAVDLDGDGTPELVSNAGGAPFSSIQALRTDGTSMWNSPSLATGLGAKLTQRPAVGDLDGDGRPDFATWAANLLQGTQGVHAVRHDGTKLWSTPIPIGPRVCTVEPHGACTQNTDCPSGTCKLHEINGSSPAIADVNGDGKPEVIVWLRDVGLGDDGTIVAFEGATGRELWRVSARDPGGIEPSVSAADLDGDGDAEVLWNGSCDGLTIVDGVAGGVLYRDPRVQSGSAHDHPAVADADADGRLEIVTGDERGLWIVGGGDGWASGRMVWNQTSYSITNVEDDLTIPVTPPEPWRFHGTFRAQGPRPVELAHASVDVTHEMAPGATFVTADVTPVPTAVAGATVEWTATFPATLGAAFDVPATLAALAPGETRAVSAGGHVDAEIVLLDGSTVQVTIPLEPATVSAPHVIGIAPASQTVDAGTPATFLVTLTNARAVAETFTLAALGIDPAIVDLPPPATVDPGASVVLPLTVTPPLDAPDGVVDFVVTASGDAGTVDDAGTRLDVVAVAPPVVAGGVRVAIVPATATVGRGGTRILDVVVSSGLDHPVTLALAALAGDLAATLSDAMLDVAPGGVAATRVTVQAAPGAPSGVRSLAVTAVDPRAPHVTDTATADVTVSDRGVEVTLSPDVATVAADGSVVLDAVVTNRGVGPDTFALAAGGPLAAFATLGAPALTLDAGASAGVSVTLAGLDVFLRQRSFVLLAATSSADPTVDGADVAAVDVGTRRSVAMRVTPGQVEHVGTGSVELALAIENTGNACDERYVVSVTSDPPGITGAIAPSRVVVPPGQTANLRLAATAASLASYDVEVSVTTDPTNTACPSLPAASAATVVGVAFVDDGATTTTTTIATTTTSSTTTTLPGVDEFVFYKMKPGTGAERFVSFAPIVLTDAFGRGAYRVAKTKQLGLPADLGAGVGDADTHLVDYQVKPDRGEPPFAKRGGVRVTNACGTLQLEVSKPSGLLAPALTALDVPPPAPAEDAHQLDHYLCYKAKAQKKAADGTPLPKLAKGSQLDVADQLQTRRYELRQVTRYCTPASTAGAPLVVSGPSAGRPVPVTAASVRRPDEDLVCYRVKLATRRIEQAGCGPLTPGDKGAAIAPKQPKHARRNPVYATSTLTAETLQSVKEAEVCLPSTTVRP